VPANLYIKRKSIYIKRGIKYLARTQHTEVKRMARPRARKGKGTGTQRRKNPRTEPKYGTRIGMGIGSKTDRKSSKRIARAGRRRLRSGEGEVFRYEELPDGMIRFALDGEYDTLRKAIGNSLNPRIVEAGKRYRWLVIEEEMTGRGGMEGTGIKVDFTFTNHPQKGALKVRLNP